MPSGIYKRTEETRRKISEAHKRKPSGALGKHWKLSKETKRKIGLSNSGKKRNEEMRRRISEGRKGKKTSEETRKRISLSHKERVRKGLHHNYKGGITPINKKIRGSIEYRLWRESVFKRDNYQCVWGGKEHGNKLNADHIKSFADFPELRFAIDNGRTLCVPCHRTTDTWGGRTELRDYLIKK